MNTYLDIELLGRAGKVTFYTYRLNDDPHTEAERFRMRFLDHPTFGMDYLEIANILKEISRRGAAKRYFRHEKSAEALPPGWIRNSNLRQYVIRICDSVLILGNGCVKRTRTAQESKDCHPKFKLINLLSERITERCVEREIVIFNDELQGELSFKFDL